MMRPLTYTLVIAAGLGFSLPVFAAPAISPEGAATLKADLTDALNWRLQLAKAAGVGEGISSIGAIDVTPKETYYEAKINTVALQMSPTEKLDLGTITLNVSPAAEPRGWVISGALPAQMNLLDPGGKPTVTISLGQQKFSAMWLPEKELIPKIDAAYNNISLKWLDNVGPTVRLGNLQFVMNLKDNGDNTWTGSSAVDMGDVSMSIPDPMPILLETKSISASSRYERLDITQQTDIRQQVTTLAQNPNAKPEDYRQIAVKYLTKATAPVDAAFSFLTLNDFSFAQKSATASNIYAGKIAKVKFEAGLQDGRTDTARAYLKSNIAGFSSSKGADDMSGLFPSDINLEMAANNLPLKKSFALLYDALQGQLNTAAPITQEQLGQQMTPSFLAIIAAMKEQGSTLTIQNSYIKSLDLNTDIKGNIATHKTAPIGAAGQISFVIKGIPNAIKKYTDLVTAGNKKAEYTNYISALGVLNMMGKVDPAGDLNVKSYTFDLTPDGQLLLNGMDIKGVTNMLGIAGKLAPTAASPAATPIP